MGEKDRGMKLAGDSMVGCSPVHAGAHCPQQAAPMHCIAAGKPHRHSPPPHQHRVMGGAWRRARSRCVLAAWAQRRSGMARGGAVAHVSAVAHVQIWRDGSPFIHMFKTVS